MHIDNHHDGLSESCNHALYKLLAVIERSLHCHLSNSSQNHKVANGFITLNASRKTEQPQKPCTCIPRVDYSRSELSTNTQQALVVLMLRGEYEL